MASSCYVGLFFTQTPSESSIIILFLQFIDFDYIVTAMKNLQGNQINQITTANLPAIIARSHSVSNISENGFIIFSLFDSN